MIKFIALSGFLGAGKTTTLVAAARLFQQRGRRVAVVTNDQGTELVDTRLARSALDSVAEITGGCFCCKFGDLAAVAQRLADAGTVDTIIAEAVGSCTDLQATVIRPLLAYYREQFSVAPLTTIVDPHRLRAFARAAQRGEPESDLSYLFHSQLEEAEILAVNKADLVRPEQMEAMLAELRQRYPAATVMACSARTGAGLDGLTGAWQRDSGSGLDLPLDYDRYASAEAQLAWLNQEFSLAAAGAAGFSPGTWATAALAKLAEIFAAAPEDIGHIKLTVDTDAGMTKMSLTGARPQPSADLLAGAASRAGRVIVNARVACEPRALDRAVLAAAAHADRVAGARSEASGAVSFRPAYPRPVHRLAAESG
jgi:Ni2+-binding GTPase involved in maturation of urease and hydrogenase